MRALSSGLVALSLVIAGCTGGGGSGKDGPPEGVEVGNTIVNVEFSDIEGNEETLHGLNAVTFIEIGTGWCPPCQSETPGMQNVYEEYQDQGFRVIQALFENYNGGNPTTSFMEQWQAEYGITFTLVGDQLQEFWNNLVPPSNTGYIPHNILLDEEGVIVYSDYGGMSETTLRNYVSAEYGE